MHSSRIAALESQIAELRLQVNSTKPKRSRGRPPRKPGERSNQVIIFTLTPREKTALSLKMAAFKTKNRSSFIRKNLGLE